MRKATLTSLAFVAFSYAANAQLSLTPRFGVEKSFTSLRYNDNQCLSPLGSVFSAQPTLRLDYKFKKTHGPFVELATNRSVVAFRFTDPETGATNYSAERGATQLRLGAGYQFSTKKMALGKSKPAMAAKSKSTAVNSRCGSYSISRCGKNAQPTAAKRVSKPMNLRIQPFVGAAFVPNPVSAVRTDAKGGTPVYQYSAGNWNTALSTGADFEFGRGSKRLFVVGVQYLKGLGNMNTETVQALSTSKQSIAHLRSNASAWNITVGVPVTLSKVKSKVKQPEVKKIQPEAKKPEAKKSCYQYRSRCSKTISL